MGEITISTIKIVPEKESKTNQRRGTKFPQFLAALTVSVASFTYGCSTGWLSPTLSILQSPETKVGESTITEEETSWLSSLPFLGAIAASPAFSLICQRFGRKAAGYITVLLFAASWINIAFSTNLLHLYIARFITGLGYGGTIVFVPLYCGEIGEDSIRGALGTFLPLLCNVATLLVYAFGPLISLQTLALSCLAFPFLFFISFYWLPETPVYLVTKGRDKEAMDAMLWLRAQNKEVAEEDILKITNLIPDKNAPNTPDTSLKALLLSRGTLRALGIFVVVCISQQFSGVYVLLNYCIDIMSKSSSALSPYVASILVALTQLLGSVLSSLCVDSFGRKTLLLISQVIMAICLGTLGTYFFLQHQGENLDAVSILPMICVSLYLFALAVGLAPVTYVLISEMFHPDVRGVTTTIVTCTIWGFAFMVTKLYPILLQYLNLHGCYWAFSGVCVICTLYTIFCIPETKNRSLESILRELNGGNVKFERFNS